MNAALLLDHYARIADAPDAIARLRRFVLDLAVRGKLLEQDAGDEPASELLKRIAAEKAQLIRQKAIKKSDVPELAQSDMPHALPISWRWARLGHIGDWGAGSTPSRGNTDLYGGGITWLKSGELNDNRALAGSEETVTEAAVRSGSFRLNQPGDVLIAMYGATIGKVAILAEPAVTNQAVCGCTPFTGMANQYLFLFLLSQREQFHGASEGGAQPNISKIKIINTPVPVPPLAEQRRIVAKVDELMALCDQLEVAWAEREAARDRFTLSTLAKLNTPDPETFNDDARFALANLAPLTTRPDQIKQLRQSILDLAVHGRLAEQDAGDEPASQLIERLVEARECLIQQKRLKRTKELLPPTHAEMPFPLPSGWQWSRIGSVYDVRDGTHATPKYVTEGYPLVTSKNLYTGNLNLNDTKLISEADHMEISQRSKVDRGDVLFAMIGSIGNPVVVDVDVEFSIKNVALFKSYNVAFSLPAFLRIVLLYSAEKMRKNAAGGLQPFVSLGFLRAFPIAFPPLAEQRRIVAKVDELMALCDQLDTSLTTGEQTRSRLLEAVLHNALEAA